MSDWIITNCVFEGDPPESIGITLRGWRDGYAAALALEQPEQEPVAWAHAGHLQGLTLGLYAYVEIYTDESQGRVPLYSAPPRREWLAAELRRLHEVNAELLVALKLYGSACDASESTPCGYTEAQCCKRARAAIAKVEGK